MVEISKAEKWVANLYPENSENAEMALSHYTVISEYNGGYVLFHTITWSLYYLTAEEYENILQNETFIKLRIVLDKNINEDDIAVRAYQKRAEWPTPFTYEKERAFVIFTTTACNARCPYCYEKGYKVIRMSERVAEGTVQYIKQKCNGENIVLRWFGGEPLLNTEVIDYITTRLNEEGIKFESKIVSNSSLLYKYADKLDDWNTSLVQITLDGIGKKYDETKNYVDATGSTFDDVIKGIYDTMNKSKSTRVIIRLNVSSENIDDLEEMLSYVDNNFGQYIKTDRIGVYVAKLFNVIKEETGEENYRISQEIDKVTKRYKHILDYDKHRYPAITKKCDMTYCTASQGFSNCINPLGKIGPCEHWSDDEVFGDVFSGITAPMEKLEEWRIRTGKECDYCKEHRCPLLPVCMRYHKCDYTIFCKTEQRREVEIRERQKSIVATYEYYLEKLEQLRRTQSDGGNK